MDITPEILDENLKELLTGGMVYTGEDRDIAAILSSKGYVNLTSTKDGDVCVITSAGRAFIAHGGYTAVEKEKEKRYKETEAAKEREKQNRLQEMEIQRIVNLELMKKDHEFQAKQNRDNRRNNIVSGIIAAIISAIVALAIKYL